MSRLICPQLTEVESSALHFLGFSAPTNRRIQITPGNQIPLWATLDIPSHVGELDLNGLTLVAVILLPAALD